MVDVQGTSTFMKLRHIFESMEGTGTITSGSISTPPGVEIRRKSRYQVKQKQIMLRRPLGISESGFAKFDVSTAMLFKIDGWLLSENNIGSSSRVAISVNTKIDNAQRQQEISKTTGSYDTSTFGLQDADGNIVRVTVDRKDAEQFETRLNTILSDTENPKEIAEILYMLRSDFDIINVDWAEPITEDDPEPNVADPTDELTLDSTDKNSTAPKSNATDELDDLDADVTSDDESDGKTTDAAPTNSPSNLDLQTGTVELLQQVIELLRKETEARAADAELKKAKTDTELESAEADKHQREINREVEMAKVSEFEDEERDKNAQAKIIQRIARYRAATKKGG